MNGKLGEWVLMALFYIIGAAIIITLLIFLWKLVLVAVLIWLFLIVTGIYQSRVKNK